MRVLSLFDGMSGAQIALERAGIAVETYFASEIDKYAIQITKKNYPNTIQLGDINNWKSWDLPEIDLIVAGFPCTSLSIAARQKESGLEKGESTLFWKLIEVFQYFKPKYFLFENVASMKKIDSQKISEVVGKQPIKINSNLVSAQNRSRLYWTNIPKVTQPEDKKLYLKDILENGVTEKNKAYCITATYARACEEDYINSGMRQLIYKDHEACALSYGRSEKGKKARKTFREEHGYDSGPRSAEYREWIPKTDGKSLTLATCTKPIFDGKGMRKLTPIECERLQTVPDFYSEGVSDTQRYKMLGNGFTIDVIAHILSFIKKSSQNA